VCESQRGTQAIVQLDITGKNDTSEWTIWTSVRQGLDIPGYSNTSVWTSLTSVQGFVISDGTIIK